MSVSISLRCVGSKPDVGSSSSTNSGSEAIACASLTRWRCPVDMVPSVRVRSSPSPTSHRLSEARVRASLRGRPRTCDRWRTKSTARISSGSTSRSGAKPTFARNVAPSLRGSSPSTVAEPDVGMRRPSSALSKVVLPAPFAPTSPVTPCCMRTSSASSAKVTPKRCVSPAVETITDGSAAAVLTCPS